MALASGSAGEGALILAAFGLGTLPLMTAISYSGSQFSALFRKKGLKTGIAALIFLAGLLTYLASFFIGAGADEDDAQPELAARLRAA